ncbi:MAG: type VI secretion protein, partial [Gammaproteobacteria bacterium]|nr:type VI secretion protein [Gammaproteobacteria bacterium]
YDYFLCSAMGVVLLFIWASSWQGQLIAIGLFFPLHLIGWLLCQRDPHIFKVLSVRASIGRVPNYSLWRCQSYAPF